MGPSASSTAIRPRWCWVRSRRHSSAESWCQRLKRWGIGSSRWLATDAWHRRDPGFPERRSSHSGPGTGTPQLSRGARPAAGRVRSCEPLRRLLAEHLGVRLIEELPVRFQCVAAGIERAIGHWFTEGPIQDAVVASAAVPGLLPPVRVGEEHYIDGGIVDSIPVGRAVTLGARTVYVLQVGRIERPLEPPTRPWEVGLVAFEIARRCRFTEEMANLPPSLEVHVLPTGADEPTRASLPPLRPTATSSGSASASSAPTRRPPRTSARSRVAEAPWSRRGWCAGSCSTRWSWCWPS